MTVVFKKQYLMIDDAGPDGLHGGLARAILNDVHINKVNMNILITGRNQYRKSTVGVVLANAMDADFSFDRDFAIIKTKDMMNALAGKAKRGTVKLLDEIGIGLDHHLWYSFFQRVMSYITQTFAFQGKILIATVPYQGLVNTDILKFFHIWIRILKKVEPKKYVVASVMTIEYDEMGKKMIYKYPRSRLTGKRIKWVRIPWKAVEENGMLDEYYRRSNAAKEGLQDDLILEADEVEAKSGRALFNAEKACEQVCANPDIFSRINQVGERYISVDLVKTYFKVGGTRAKTVKVLAEGKLGYGMSVKVSGDAQIS